MPSTPPSGTRLRIAVSPDADDAFMLFGLATGAVRAEGLDVELSESDVETLNRRALGGDLEVTAISFGAWPRFAGAYDLLRVGSSFGLGVGPKLVAAAPARPEDLSGRTVAIPGAMTTAALVLALMETGCRTVVLPFDRIAQAVAAGETDAGLVIHEGQLTWQRQGLHLVADLGRWWSDATGGMPLPLGATAIRRDIPGPAKQAAADALRRSIEHALAHREAAVAHALRDGRGRGLDARSGDAYVATYVNRLTLDPGPEGEAAVAELYRRAAAARLLPAVTPRWSG